MDMHSDLVFSPMGLSVGLIAGLLYLVGLLIWVWAIVQTIKSNESDGAKVAWILVLIFVPVLGLIIWLFAGPRAKKS